PVLSPCLRCCLGCSVCVSPSKPSASQEHVLKYRCTLVQRFALRKHHRAPAHYQLFRVARRRDIATAFIRIISNDSALSSLFPAPPSSFIFSDFSCASPALETPHYASNALPSLVMFANKLGKAPTPFDPTSKRLERTILVLQKASRTQTHPP